MGRWWRGGCTAIGLLMVGAAPCRAADGDGPLLVPLAQTAHDLIGSVRRAPPETVVLGGVAGPWADDGPRPRPGIDASPVVDAVLGFLNHHGLPLRGQRDERGGGLVGVQAAFAVGRDLPAVSFNLGDRPVEPLGAFYSAKRGFRCAVVWPIDRFTLRLEGGEDSELGYYGIAGVQWVAREVPLAIGVGLPMNLRQAEGGVGMVVQLRMRLD